MVLPKDGKKILIGKRITAIYNGLDIEGIILDETKETFIVDIEGNRKTLLKNNLWIKVVNGKETLIDCKKIRLRPHERIKLK